MAVPPDGIWLPSFRMSMVSSSQSTTSRIGHRAGSKLACMAFWYCGDRLVPRELGRVRSESAPIEARPVCVQILHCRVQTMAEILPIGSVELGDFVLKSFDTLADGVLHGTGFSHLKVTGNLMTISYIQAE